jgi:hypothetical protein
VRQGCTVFRGAKPLGGREGAVENELVEAPCINGVGVAGDAHLRRCHVSGASKVRRGARNALAATRQQRRGSNFFEGT